MDSTVVQKNGQEKNGADTAGGYSKACVQSLAPMMVLILLQAVNKHQSLEHHVTHSE